MLFTFINQRYLQGSLLVIANLAFADWGEVFGNVLIVGLVLDSLTRSCHIVQFTGQSFRFHQSLEREQLLAEVGLGMIAELGESTVDSSRKEV